MVKQFIKKQKVLCIYIRCVNDQLSVSAHEQFRNEHRTIEFFEDLRISHNKIDDKCHKLFNLLNNASKQLRVDRSIIDQAKYIGQSLFDGLFTLRVKELLYSTECRELILEIDGNLVQIPWELLYDGTDFLCQRFNIGRIVNTWQSIASHRGQERRKRPFNIDKNPFKMLILADPKGDLDASYEEGDILFEKFKDLSEHKDLQKNIEIKLKSSFIETEYIKKALREFDIIHYAGHAKYNAEDPSRGGWQTADGEVSTDDIIEMIGGGALPYLIFSNACQSGQTEPWSISSDGKKGVYGLANAFLLAGVYHYIGTFWDIPDKQGLRLAVEFYKNLMKGVNIGESLRRARVHLIHRYGEANITWMAYMLYGDPTYVYLGRENLQDKEHFQAGQGVYIPDNFAEQSKSEGINYSSGIEPANTSESLESVLAGETRGAESDTMGGMESENIFLKPISLKLTRPLKTALFLFLFVFIVVGISWLGKTFFFSSNAPDPNPAYVSLFDKDYFEPNRQKSDLADREKDLIRIGKVLGARFILFSELMPDKKKPKIAINVIETETTVIKVSFISQMGKGEGYESVAGRIAKKVVAKIKERYPLKGKITAMNDAKEVMVNLGSDVGLKKKFIMNVLGGLDEPEQIGRIEITKVDQCLALAKVLQAKRPLRIGDRVIATPDNEV